MAVNTAIAGKRFGFLTTAYTDGRARKIVCYCVCSKQVHVAIDELKAGIIDSCGCQPPPAAWWDRYAQLRSQLKREIGFSIAKSR